AIEFIVLDACRIGLPSTDGMNGIAVSEKKIRLCFAWKRANYKMLAKAFSRRPFNGEFDSGPASFGLDPVDGVPASLDIVGGRFDLHDVADQVDDRRSPFFKVFERSAWGHCLPKISFRVSPTL